MLPHSGAIYIKHTVRKALDLAIVGVAALVTVDGDSLSDVRIAIGAAAPTPIRVKAAEKLLKNQKLSDDLLEKAGQAALEAAIPIDDIRASAEYRRKMVKVLTIRAVKQAVEQVKQEVR